MDGSKKKNQTPKKEIRVISMNEERGTKRSTWETKAKNGEINRSNFRIRIRKYQNLRNTSTTVKKKLR